jgi:exonuclease III
MKSAEMVDTFRSIYPGQQAFTFGKDASDRARLDYILVDKDHEHFIKEAGVVTQKYGSDHSPIMTRLDCRSEWEKEYSRQEAINV